VCVPKKGQWALEATVFYHRDFLIPNNLTAFCMYFMALLCMLGVACLLGRSRITVNDILSALEDDDDFNKADIYLTPPDNGAGSDEDSDSEDCVSANNLSGKQLRAQAMPS